MAKWVYRLLPVLLIAVYLAVAAARHGWGSAGAILVLSLFSLAVIWFPGNMAYLFLVMRWSWLLGEWELPAWLPPAIGWAWLAILGIQFLVW